MIAEPRPGEHVDEQRLRDALDAANIPTLVMVLFQLTGDERWLQDPYRPTLTRGLTDHDTGGLDDDVQREIRAAAADAILAWSRDGSVAVPHPTAERLEQMMSVCMGEPVPPQYASLMLDEYAGPQRTANESGDTRFSVVVIGAGVAGTSAALMLRDAGVDVVVLEKNAHVGGTWLENDYPGAGVDTPSYLYSFSFFPRNWTTHFGKRDEVLAYLQEMAEHFDLLPLIRFGTEVTSAVYDEDRQRWTVEATSADGTRTTLTANAVISAVGLLSRPKVPDLPGLDAFAGDVFHSAYWPADLDVTGKRVAVVGTGASAMQIVPAIAGTAGSLSIFQRSPQWVAPNENYFRPVGDDIHWLMEHVPYYHRWYRFRLSWTYNDKVHASLQIDPAWEDPDHSLNEVNAGHRRAFTRYLRRQLDDREDLIAKALPQYPPFGKRMLLDNGWYAALTRPEVELVTESVAGLTGTGVRTTSGAEYEADVVVLCTGFDALRMLHPLDIRGRHGRTIREAWGDDDASAYLGITTPGFPNLFIMYGPNTNSGAGGSYVFLAECQARYIVQLVQQMIASDIGAVEVRDDVHTRYNADVDAAHAVMVWTHPGMQTYYRNVRGRVVTNSPWRIIDYWQRTRFARLEDFDTEPRADVVAAGSLPGAGGATPDPREDG